MNFTSIFKKTRERKKRRMTKPGALSRSSFTILRRNVRHAKPPRILTGRRKWEVNIYQVTNMYQVQAHTFSHLILPQYISFFFLKIRSTGWAWRDCVTSPDDQTSFQPFLLPACHAVPLSACVSHQHTIEHKQNGRARKGNPEVTCFST